MSAEWPATRLDMTHFILLAGARGPFLPQWTPAGWHWSQAFTDRLGTYVPGSGRAVRLVGTTIRCPLPTADLCAASGVEAGNGCTGPTLRGEVLATDALGFEVLRRAELFDGAADDGDSEGEELVSRSMLGAGFNLASLQVAQRNVDWSDPRSWRCPQTASPAQAERQQSPFETIFDDGSP